MCSHILHIWEVVKHYQGITNEERLLSWIFPPMHEKANRYFCYVAFRRDFCSRSIASISKLHSLGKAQFYNISYISQRQVL